MDELEKEIADSKQKIEFFHAKMQELVSISAYSGWSFLSQNVVLIAYFDPVLVANTCLTVLLLYSFVG